MAEDIEQAEIVGETSIDPHTVYEALRECYDPEIPVNIVDLGLIYLLRIEGAKVEVTMTLTAIGCPVAGEVMAEVEGRVREVAGVEHCEVTLTFEPPWTPDRMTEDAKWELGIG
jgi:FeS assembly SUF system protein